MQQDREKRLDTTYDSERGRGSTAPEQGAESSSVVGRPATERPVTAFHDSHETVDQERQHVDEATALEQGGSFDGLAPPNERNEH